MKLSSRDETHFVRSLDLSLDAENPSETTAELKAKQSKPALQKAEVVRRRVEGISERQAERLESEKRTLNSPGTPCRTDVSC